MGPPDQPPYEPGADQTHLLAKDIAGLALLTPLKVLFRAIDPETESNIRQLLPKLPLLAMVKEVMACVVRSPDKQEQKALRELVKHLIAKHPYTRELYEAALEAITRQNPAEPAQFASRFPIKDAPLVMEMLALISDLLGQAGDPAGARYAFDMQEAICRHFKLPDNLGITLHQKAIFEWQVMGNLDEAAELLDQALEIFKQYLPEFCAAANVVRAEVYSRRLARHPELPIPEDLGQFAASHPKVQRQIGSVKLYNALEADDLAEAGRLISELDRNPVQGEDSPLLTLLKSRYARRQGRFEQAEILLAKAELAGSEGLKDMLNWQRFYLERDQQTVRGGEILASSALAKSETGGSLRYQKALMAYYQKDMAQAETLFKNALARSDDPAEQANCCGMLGDILPGTAGYRYLYRALALYHKLNKTLDFAISLSHLADKEIEEGTAMQGMGYPPEFLFQFRRAESLLQWSGNIAAALGKNLFLIGLQQQLGQLQLMREAYPQALAAFEDSLAYVESAYIDLADQGQADDFFAHWGALIGMSVLAADAAGQPAKALVIVERVKGRRLLRDLAHLGGQGSDHPETGSLAQKIGSLRKKLLQGEKLSPAQRQALLDAEDRLKATTGYADLFQTIDNEQLWASVFGTVPIPTPGHQPPPPAEGREMQGGGVMQCEHCGIFNKITATFCAVCSESLPKSAVFFMDEPTEEQWRSQVAEGLYRQAVVKFLQLDMPGAFTLAGQSLDMQVYAPALLLKGICLLGSGETEGIALVQVADELKFQDKYPFWNLPLSPAHIAEYLQALVQPDADLWEISRQMSMELSNYYSPAPGTAL